MFLTRPFINKYSSEKDSKKTNAFSIIDRAVSKGIVHKATAAREKSNLQRLINKAAK